MLRLKLERPLAIFDVESTGVNAAFDRIVEISVIKLTPDGGEIANTRRINPEMPIPPSVTEIHGITDADVKDAPVFAEIAFKLNEFLADCDLGGYNLCLFDIPILVNEFKRAGIEFDLTGRRVIDVYNLYCKLYPRTLAGAYKFFCGGDFSEAHSAEADTRATLEVLAAQLDKHGELSDDVAELAAFCDMTDPLAVDKTKRFKWQDGDVVVNFGKNIGRRLKDIAVNDPGFLRWIARADFSDEVKKIASDALIGVFPEKKS